MNEVTRILTAVEQGDPHAANQLLPLVYNELRKLVAQRLAQEKPGPTLQATALVHDAYLQLIGGGDGQPLEKSRGTSMARPSMRCSSIRLAKPTHFCLTKPNKTLQLSSSRNAIQAAAFQ